MKKKMEREETPFIFLLLMSAPKPSITETPNPITAHIDVAPPLGILHLLRQTDQQLFSGWGEDYPSSLSRSVIDAVAEVAELARDLLTDTADNAIVLSGSGTSGRFAFLTARAFNQHLEKQGKPRCFYYLCAGGDASLFMSKEAPEDNWRLGIDTLDAVVKLKRRVLFIGITCGLSAPIVAGQLAYCMDHRERITAVLLGFNPIERARDLAIEGWDQTFHTIVDRMNEIRESDLIAGSRPSTAFILPIIGPEPITGSTRMKGGSATKFILETLFTLAMQPTAPVDPNQFIVDAFLEYQVAIRETYYASEAIVPVIEAAGRSLGAGCHVYYISEDTFGIAALIDASECPPTYNAHPNDIRAFISQGFKALGNDDGDLEHLGKSYLLSLESFQREFAPNLTGDDLVVLVTGVLSSDTLMTEICQSANVRHAKIMRVSINSPKSPTLDNLQWNCNVEIRLSKTGLTASPPNHMFLAEMSCKIVLNAVSTAAHILKGKVMGNFMIDLQVSNNKLFHRSIGIVAKFAQVETDQARISLLRAIHGVDVVTSEVRRLCDRLPTDVLTPLFHPRLKKAKSRFTSKLPVKGRPTPDYALSR